MVDAWYRHIVRRNVGLGMKRRLQISEISWRAKSGKKCDTDEMYRGAHWCSFSEWRVVSKRGSRLPNSLDSTRPQQLVRLQRLIS